MNSFKAGYADGTGWYMTFESKWSRMLAVHESIHDEIVKETPYGQIYSLMSQLVDVQQLSEEQKRRAQILYYGCAEGARRVHEVAATYLGWLSIGGEGHLEARNDLPPSYQGYLDEALSFATFFAQSRFIHYTIVQASTYLAFHHRALWQVVRTQSLDDFVLPDNAHPDALWNTIRSTLMQMPSGLMKELMAPTCERLGLNFDEADTHFDFVGPNQIQWIESNEELVKDLRVALGHRLKIDAILDPDERETFHVELCAKVEQLFDVEIERIYSRTTTHHHLFPDEIASHCPLEIILEAPAGGVLETLASLQHVENETPAVTMIQSDKHLTLIASHRQLGSGLFRWHYPIEMKGNTEALDIRNIPLSLAITHHIQIVSPYNNHHAIEEWLTATRNAKKT